MLAEACEQTNKYEG